MEEAPRIARATTLWRLSLEYLEGLGALADRGEVGGKGASGIQCVCVCLWGGGEDSVILTRS